jgi:Predicted transcriptional regulator
VTFHQRLNLLCKQKGTSISALLSEFGMSSGNTTSWKNGVTPKIDVVIKFAERLDVTTDYLLGKSPYKHGDEPSKIVPERILTSIKVFDAAVSAGVGEWLEEGYDYEWAEFENVPQGADFALSVRGDSMEPMYSDGDIIFIKKNVLVESGQIGVFNLNGDGYLKQLQGNRLVSLNTVYAPIVVNDYDDFYVFGRVVGRQARCNKKEERI